MNGAEPRRIPSYNVFWRKLRRRYHVHPYYVSLAFFTAMPTICVLAWLSGMPELRWLVAVTSAFWVGRSLGMLLPSLLFLLARPRKPAQAMPPMVWRTQSLSAIGALAEIVALLMGRIDVAAGILYGQSVLQMLFWQGQREEKIKRQALITIGTEIGILGALAFRAYPLAALLIVAETVKPYLFSDRRGLLEYATSLPTRAEYVIRTREQCAAGGG